MKRKVHIILRFSKQVNPPPGASAASAPSEFSSPAKYTPPAASFTTVNESSDSAQTEAMARQSSDNEGAGARSGKRKRNVQNKYKNSHNHDTAALPTPSPSAPTPPSISSAPQLIGKRKRPVPKSIGGGKGDLQPPAKKTRKSTASKQPTVLTTTQSLNGAEKKDGDKRVTRSQDTQQKSELAEWFEDRDEDDFVVDVDYPMKVVENDNTPRNTRSASKTRTNHLTNGYFSNGVVDINGSEAARLPEAVTVSLEAPVAEFQNPTPTTHKVVIQTIDLEAEARASNSRLTRFAADPLVDDIYIKPHTSMGREEKRLRNVERDRAAHDKQRYEDRLEKLRGADWIKTFNLGTIAQKLGMAEMEKRKAGVVKWHESLLRKFKAWKEEEKRRKLAAAGRMSRSLTNSQEREIEEFEDPNWQGIRSGGEGDDGKVEEKDIYAITDDSDEGDHRHHLKKHRHTLKPPRPSHRLTTTESSMKKYSEPKPFTSFYNNPHMRQAVLNTSRKSSRNLKPFGVPLPDLEEKVFELPEEYYQQTARHLRARRRLSK